VATCSRWPSAWVVPGPVLPERSPRVSAVASVQRRGATQARPAVPADPRAPRRLVVVVGGTARTGRCPPSSALVHSPMPGERQAMAEGIRPHQTERRSMRAVAAAPPRCVSAGRRAGSVATRPRMPNALADSGSAPSERSPRVSAVASIRRRFAAQARPAAHVDPKPSRRFAAVASGTARTARCPPTSVPACSPGTREPQATAAVSESRTGLI